MTGRIYMVVCIRTAALLGLLMTLQTGNGICRPQQRQEKADAEGMRLLELGNRFLSASQTDSAIRYFNKAKDLFIQRPDPGSAAKAYTGLGQSLYRAGKIPEAIRNNDSALMLYTQLRDTSGMSEALGNGGFYYYRQYRLTASFELVSRSLHYAELSGNEKAIFKANYYLAILYLELDTNLEMPKRYLLRAMELNKTIGDSALELNIKSYLSTIYQREGNFAGAIGLLQELIAHFRSRGKAYEEGIMLHNLGYVYTRMKDFRQSIRYYEMALARYLDAGDSASLADEYYSIAMDLSEQKKYPEAIKKLFAGMSISHALGDIENECDLAQALEEVFEKSGQYREALFYNRRYYELRDSLNSREQNEKLLELKTKFETGQKDKEISLLNKDKLLQQAESSKQRQLKNVFLAGFAALLIIALLLYNRYQVGKSAARLLEEKNRQIQLEKERAEQSEKIKQQFLATMSHEIRTPMNAIIGLSNLLVHRKTDEQGKRYANAIRHSAGNLLRLINDILDFSKLEAGKARLQTEPFRIYNTLDFIYDSYLPLALEKGVELEVQVEKNFHGYVYGDEGKLTQILINLVGNALKFTPRGSVVLKVKQSELSDKMVTFDFLVKDTGIGISPEEQPHVFEQFRQGNALDNREFGGTGLGLSIATGLVELHGAKLSMKSEPGKGSEFSFRLAYPVVSDPGERVEILKKKDNVPSCAYKGAVAVLLAEDNPYNLLVATDTLKRYFKDITITSASNGKEVMDRLALTIPDLVLLDIQMPLQDGFETIRLLRAAGNPAWNRLPVVAFTASVMRSDLEKCLDAGMNGCVQKPFSEKDLVDAVIRFTGKSFTAIPIEPEQEEPDDEQKFRLLFLKLVPQRLDLIEKALLKGDWNEIRHVVHQMRPQLEDMGLEEKMLMATEFEQMDGAVPFRIWKEKTIRFCRLVREKLNEVILQNEQAEN